MHLESVVGEMGIRELEMRASRDIELAEDHLFRESPRVMSNKRTTGVITNHEVFTIIAECENEIYKIHCRQHEMSKRGRKMTRGTLRCVGVIRHFLNYLLSPGPFDIVARDRDGYWTVTCSVATLQVDYVLPRIQEIAVHLDLLEVAT